MTFQIKYEKKPFKHSYKEWLKVIGTHKGEICCVMDEVSKIDDPDKFIEDSKFIIKRHFKVL